MAELTEQQAKELYESRFWEDMTHEERARFQLWTERLCMPFDVFQEAVENTLGRPVWTHEFAQPGALKAEMMGCRPAPTMQEIIDMVPEDKRIIVSA